jgi:hypothetical protein
MEAVWIGLGIAVAIAAFLFLSDLLDTGAAITDGARAAAAAPAAAAPARSTTARALRIGPDTAARTTGNLAIDGAELIVASPGQRLRIAIADLTSIRRDGDRLELEWRSADAPGRLTCEVDDAAAWVAALEGLELRK